MRTNVLQFLINLPKSLEAQFNEAFALFRKSQHKNLASERFYNSAGFSKVNLQNLLYDLKMLHNITDSQIRVSKKAAKKESRNSVPKIELAFEDIKNKSAEELVAFLQQEKVEMPIYIIPKDYNDLKAFAKELNLKPVSNKKVAIEDAILKFIEAEIVRIAVDYLNPSQDVDDLDVIGPIEVTATSKEEVFPNAPNEVKETVKLRDEFPFLDDPECPEELFILVGKKFAHYNAYVKAHKALMVVVENEEVIDGPKIEMTPEQIFELAKTAVENFELNQDIYAELNYYKEHGKILGTHPIFFERNLKAKTEEMSVPDATKRMQNLENYIRRDSKKRDAKKTSEADKAKLVTKVIEWEYELKLVKAKLGFSDKE